MISEPQCYIRECKHFRGVKQPDDSEDREFPYCTAFPGGIPDDIAFGDNKHLSPVRGDHGIQYERARSTEALERAILGGS